MSPAADMSDVNLKVYKKSGTVGWYAQQSGMFPDEEGCLSLIDAHWKGRDILDIGIGGGRTSQALEPLAKSYVGVDYSAEMVEAAKARFPAMDLRKCDARDLSEFADKSFDFVFFSFNGIDAVNHADRMQILAEVRRVLRPGGVFLFNSHNRNWVGNDKQWRDLFSITASRTPVQALKAVARIPIRIGNYMRTLRDLQETEAYAIKLDAGNNFASPHYYVSAPEAVQQLRQAGYAPMHIVDDKGVEVAQGVERNSATLHYIAARSLES
jgi:ubiquinone/menaquinone biosynthesis C-methylase UbiE